MARAGILLITILVLAGAPAMASLCLAGCEPAAKDDSHGSAAHHAHGSNASQPESTDEHTLPLHDTDLCCEHGASALSTSRAAEVERRAIPHVVSVPSDLGHRPRNLDWTKLQPSEDGPPPAPSPSHRVLRI